MKYQIFTTSERAWEGMRAAIAAAKKSVYVQMYIVAQDEAGHGFLDELGDAAKRGVKVICILDTFGSMDLKNEKVNKLREAGAEVLYCSFFFQRMHRKVLIADETVAFIGGVNIGERYARWKDLQIRVTGPIVQTILRSFARAYKACGGKGYLASLKHRPGILKKAKLWFVDHGIGVRSTLFRKYYTERISHAKESLVLVTPYLFPPRWLLVVMHQAIIRGVSLEILLPFAPDHWFASTINRAYASVLTKLGARVYFAPGMNHAKAMLIDNREGIIGSQNLDFFSFHFNIEAGVFFHEPDTVEQLTNIINEWKKPATLFDAKQDEFRWYDPFLAFFLRLFGFVPLWKLHIDDMLLSLKEVVYGTDEKSEDGDGKE